MKKKIIIAIILCVVFILGALGIYSYQKKVQGEQEMVYEVYRWIPTEEYGEKNPLDLGISISKLEKNPPKVEMNGSEGLYVSVMAYNHATGNSIDYEDIKELMEQGKPLEVYENYQDYLEWFLRPDTSGRYVTGYGTDYRGDYAAACISTAATHGISLNTSSSSYEDYKKVIEMYPDEIEQWFNGSKNNE